MRSKSPCLHDQLHRIYRPCTAWGRVREPLKSSPEAHGEFTEHCCPSHTILPSFGNSVSKYLGHEFHIASCQATLHFARIYIVQRYSKVIQIACKQSANHALADHSIFWWHCYIELTSTEAATVFNIAAIASRASFLLDLLDVRGSSISCKYLSVHFSFQLRL